MELNENVQMGSVTDFSKESIKLIRNSRGFNWEIKILPSNELLDEKDLKRLNELNTKLEESYGNKGNIFENRD